MNTSSSLNAGQLQALGVLRTRDNIFLTGAAGSGKSFLLRHYLQDQSYPILASTGAAAILVGGRTFHSYFGLGIMEGGFQATVDRAISNQRLNKRLRKADTVIIDEVSMLSGPTLEAANAIAKVVRNNSTPWGGIRIIAVGDFAQLPPVNPYGKEKEWAFLNPCWEESDFKPIILNEIMRTADVPFLRVLNDVRTGRATKSVCEFLQSRVSSVPADFNGTRLFSRKNDVENFNLKQLDLLPGKERVYETSYSGRETEIEKFKKHSPISDVIRLKEGALVMLRQNDTDRQWVNGSLGYIRQMKDLELSIELLDGPTVKVSRAEFSLLDAEGDPVVQVTNFPVSLAWAVTIHKAQGTTLQRACMDLRNLWEPGQAYVALSRVQSPSGLFIQGWHPTSIKADPVVTQFYQRCQELSECKDLKALGDRFERTGAHSRCIF